MIISIINAVYFILDSSSSSIPKRRRANDVSKSSRSLDMGSCKSQSVNQGSSSKSVTVDPSLTSFFIIASQVEEDDVCIKFFSFSFRKIYS